MKKVRQKSVNAFEQLARRNPWRQDVVGKLAIRWDKKNLSFALDDQQFGRVDFLA